MSDTIVKKIQLVSKNGLSIAEVPSLRTEEKKQLESGLLSAMLAFSREVHNSELQSLSFHDRIVSFIPSGNYFLVPEFSSSISKKLLVEITEEMKNFTDSMLQERLEVSYEFAEDILHKLTNRQWINKTMNELKISQPLQDGKSHSFELVIGEDGFELINHTGNHGIINKIASILYEYKNEIDTSDTILKFIFPLENENKCIYLFAIANNDHYYKIGYLTFDHENIIQLFRMHPLIADEIDYLHSTMPSIGPEEIAERLRELHDIGYEIEQTNLDNISFRFLENQLKKSVHETLPSIVRGEPVLVIGEKIAVRVAISTYALFTQHLMADIIDWLEVEKGIGRNLTGMSIETFEKLQEQKNIPENVTIIDLENNKIHGGQKNQFLSDLWNTVKSINPDEAIIEVSDSLDNLVSLSLDIASLVLLDKDIAENKLHELEKNNRNGKFDLAIALAKQRNPILDSIITEVSKTLWKAESFLGDF